MALTVIKPSGIDTSGNYTVTGMNVSANASIANLTVTTSSNLGAVGNVTITGGTTGYYLQTNGSGVLSWAAVPVGSGISNGTSNINIPVINGNINFSSAGTTTMVVTGTGANITGTANISGNANVGNIGATGGYFTTVAGNLTTNSQPNITSVGTLTSLGVNGTVTATAFTANTGVFTGNANGLSSIVGANVTGQVSYAATANSVAGANVSGAVSYATTANSVAGGNVSGAVGLATFASTANAVAGANVSGAVSFATTANAVAGANVSGAVSFATTANAVAGANVSGQVANSLIAGTVYTNAQPNITSVGTLTSLTVSGNASVGNIVASGGGGGNITGANLVSANFFTGTLTTAAQPNITSVGILTTLGVNGTLIAVNITANTGVFTGNGNGLSSLVAANITGQVANALISGTVYTNAQPNITSVGTLTSLLVNNTVTAVAFTANTGVFTGNANGLSSLVGANVTGQVANSLIAGTVYTNSQPNITSVGTLSTLTVSGNANVGNLITGGGNITGANLVSANFFTGTLTTAAQPNITSVGILTGLGVNGTLTAVNITANTGVFTGNGNGLSSIVGANVTGQVSYAATANAVAGANVSGQVANSLIAGTVYTNAQPNITSVGTLTSVSVSGTSNLGAVGNVTITGGSSGYYLQTNGSGTLTWAAVPTGSGISNGTSNVDIPVASGNVNISSAGNANVLIVTGTGINVAGTLNTGSGIITGNGNGLSSLVAANITGQVANSLIAGTVYTNAQPNITSIGTLTSLNVSGNANTGNLGTNNFIATGTGSFGANVNLNTYWINNVGYPSANTDAASKLYVDTLVSSGVSYHPPVLVATTTTLAIATSGTTSYVSPNGASNGIGAYISTTGTYLNIDSANVQTVGTRILVKDESNAAWNGVYTYANTTAIIRSTDTDEYGPNSTEQLSVNDFFFTQGGIVNEGVGFIVSAPSGVITFGTSNITFSVFSTSQIYDAGTGLTLTGTTFSVNASQTQITSVGTLTGLNVNGNITAANITANTGVFTGNGNGLSSIVGANVTGQVTYAGTANSVAGANVTGAVTYATTANAVAGANVSGQVGYAATANSVAGANITGAVTYATTANAVAGANVSGQVANSLISGTVYTNAQPNITSVGTLTSLTVSGNATVGNIVASGGGGGNITGANLVSANYFTGTLTTAAQPNITSVGTLTSLLVNNTVTAVAFTANTGVFTGNANGLSSIVGANVTGQVSYAATANAVAGANVSGAVTYATTANSVAGANVSGQVANSLIAGTVYTNAQPNITSVGTLTTLGVNGTLTAVSFTANTGVFTGNANGLSSIVGANVSGQVANALVASTIYTNAQPNITSVGTLTTLGVNGTVTATAFTANTGVFTGNGNGLSSIVGANVTGQVSYAATANAVAGANVSGQVTYAATANSVAGANVTGQVGNSLIAGTVYTNAQPNITSTGTLTSLSVTGNISAGNVSATTFTGALTGLASSATVAASANSVAGANVSGQVGNALVAGTVYTNAQPNITSIGTLTSLTVSGTTNLGAVGNVTITGGTNGYVLSTNGSGVLSWVAQSAGGSTSNISNGNSNVNIPSSNGNVNISAVGNANILVITGTGANVTGTLYASANANLGNSVTANFFIGSGNNLSNIQGANVTGAVSYATTANSVAVANVSGIGNIATTNYNGNGSTILAGNGAWVSGTSTVTITVDNFTGTGSQTAFILSVTPSSINQTSVNYNGATVLRTDYSLTGNTITFSSAPASSSAIEVTTTNLTSGGSGGITAQDLLSPFLLMGA